MSSVPSVEPSLTITHFVGRTVCATTDLIVSSMNSASFLAGVTRTYDSTESGLEVTPVGSDMGLACEEVTEGDADNFVSRTGPNGLDCDSDRSRAPASAS